MYKTINITSGDIIGKLLEESTVQGEVFVWHDVMYEGRRNAGWPNEESLQSRVTLLEEFTEGKIGKASIQKTLNDQYQKIESLNEFHKIILWFDACLFDQSMLAHILTCIKIKEITGVELICINEFSGVEPFDGLGQLNSKTIGTLIEQSKAVTAEHYEFAKRVDKAFALQDIHEFENISKIENAPLPFVPAAVQRWLLEQPNSLAGLGRLEDLILASLASGCKNPIEIFKVVSSADSHPIYWGDTTLWAKINGLTKKEPPRVKIEGPTELLPFWEPSNIDAYTITLL